MILSRTAQATLNPVAATDRTFAPYSANISRYENRAVGADPEDEGGELSLPSTSTIFLTVGWSAIVCLALFGALVRLGQFLG
jgi:hypothetical protein